MCKMYAHVQNMYMYIYNACAYCMYVYACTLLYVCDTVIEYVHTLHTLYFCRPGSSTSSLDGDAAAAAGGPLKAKPNITTVCLLL